MGITCPLEPHVSSWLLAELTIPYEILDSLVIVMVMRVCHCWKIHCLAHSTEIAHSQRDHG